jgi:hypothetical protein
MTLEELTSFCQNKEWGNLFPILSSSVKDLSVKILVTAVIEAYHPDRTEAHSRGLSCWAQDLSGSALSSVSSLFSSSVDLGDFSRAFYIAKNSLKDPVVANAIKTFVRKHKLILGQKLLRDAEISDECKQQIRDAFGDLRASRYERETEARQQQASFRKNMIEHLKAVDQVKDQLAPVLGLKARLFSVSFSAPGHAKAFRAPLGSFPEIKFDASIKTEEFKALETKLAAYGIRSGGHDMSWMYGEGASRGIQIFSGNAATIAQNLASPPKENAPSSEALEDEKKSAVTPSI